MANKKEVKPGEKAFRMASALIALVLITGMAASALGLRTKARRASAAARIAPEQVVISWQRVGGVAGECEAVQIHVGGQADLIPCAASQASKTTTLQLSNDQIAQLQGWVQNWHSFDVQLSEPGISSRAQVHLTFRGVGLHPASDNEQQDMERFIEGLILSGGA